MSWSHHVLLFQFTHIKRKNSASCIFLQDLLPYIISESSVQWCLFGFHFTSLYVHHTVITDCKKLKFWNWGVHQWHTNFTENHLVVIQMDSQMDRQADTTYTLCTLCKECRARYLVPCFPILFSYVQDFVIWKFKHVVHVHQFCCNLLSVFR